ncbi:MMPL family transporter [Ornithinimicrobium sp. Y1694]|uniref:MMPL family transporter n=1 Tax=Ornithinimicrobium sp. Y1694 TaxID=3418590 RepID=UPI003CEA5402
MPWGPIPSEDGRAAMLQVPVTVDEHDSSALREVVDHARDAVAAGRPDGLVAQTTGGPAFGADLAASFDGANLRLLLVTVGVVGLLLLLTYRSPVLWLVPITVVGLADQVAAVLTAQLGSRLDLNFDAGIISVLVFGAGANYALLLISRYREELRTTPDHRSALATAWRATLPAILASNISVVLALATLVLAVIPGTRGVGIAAAVGLLVALLFALFVLPPALAIVGRQAFWPFIPQPEEGIGAKSTSTTSFDPFGAVASAVVRRPWAVLTAGLALLAVMATGVLGTQVGLTQTDRFRVTAESADALEPLAAHFPAGAANPIIVVTDSDHLDEVEATLGDVEGVERVSPGPSGTVTTSTDTADAATREITTVLLTTDAVPGSDHERELVGELREVSHGIPGANALVGGGPATDVDVREGSERDLLVVAPLVLLVVAAILALLLRSLVAPVVLMAVNVASTLATIGTGAWLGRQFFGWDALDTPVPLLAFLFLVALGIDYTIFLVHRVQAEAAALGTRQAVVKGVSTTGVVITSAGIVLAGVFAALGVLPLVTLGQLGLIVGLGVVVDTMLVRTVLVPAVITLLGDRFWWPGRPAAHLSR